jgi:uncharacterized protein with PQ loop repeat
MSYHQLAVTFGWAAVLLTVGGTIAQFRRAARLSIEGVSLATWTLFVFMSCFWVTYGADQRSAIIILGSLLTLPFQVAIVLRLKFWRRWPVVTRAFAFSLVFCALPTLMWGWPGGVYGTGVAMVANRAPQLIELIRYPDATGVSVAMWFLGVAGALCWVIYYQNIRLWAALASAAVAGLASLSIALMATWRHRRAQGQRLTKEAVLAQA